MGLFRVILAIGLAATSLWAADASGEWTAEVEGRHGTISKVTIRLVQEDGELTGTVQDPDGETNISSADVDGDEIRFTVITDSDGYQITRHYRGTVEDDIIHFSLSMDDGRRHSASRDFEAQRVR